MTPPVTDRVVYCFDPFSLRHGSHEGWHEYVQSVIFYGESRIRKALARVIHHKKGQEHRLQRILCEEVFFFMSYVGMASAMGILADVPIVLRSVACTFAKVEPSELPVKFDCEFLQLLELGTNPTDPFYVVENYGHDWWTGTPKTIVEHAINQISLKDCLLIHEEELQKISTDPELPDLPAQQPEQNLLSALVHTHTVASAQASAAATSRSLYARRASGFLLLHEASISILDGLSTRKAKHIHKPTARRQIADREVGAAEARRIAVMEQQNGTRTNVGSQWTVGRPLSDKEVLDLCAPADKHIQSHDGYLRSLGTGDLSGVWSPEESVSTNESRADVASDGEQLHNITKRSAMPIPESPPVLGSQVPIPPTVPNLTKHSADSPPERLKPFQPMKRTAGDFASAASRTTSQSAQRDKSAVKPMKRTGADLATLTFPKAQQPNPSVKKSVSDFTSQSFAAPLNNNSLTDVNQLETRLNTPVVHRARSSHTGPFITPIPVQAIPKHPASVPRTPERRDNRSVADLAALSLALRSSSAPHALTPILREKRSMVYTCRQDQLQTADAGPSIENIQHPTASHTLPHVLLDLRRQEITLDVSNCFNIGLGDRFRPEPDLDVDMEENI